MGWLLGQAQSKCILRACCGMFIHLIFPEHPLCVRQSHVVALGVLFHPPAHGAVRTVGPLLSIWAVISRQRQGTHLLATLESGGPEPSSEVIPLTC